MGRKGPRQGNKKQVFRIKVIGKFVNDFWIMMYGPRYDS